MLVPGLAIRVTPAGHKSFTLYYRHHGRMRRVGLGRYPDVLLADARTAATNHRGRIFHGADPAEERKAERATHGDTVGALYDLYKSHREKTKSWTETRRIMEREVLPVWRHLRVGDVKRRTAASYMGEAGVDRFHIAHVLNHRSVTHSTVTAIYDRYRYDKEKRAALEKWAEVLTEIVNIKPAPTAAPARPITRANVYEFKPHATRRAQASVH
jgi:sugar phosphate isomerase/epimerase